jgi:hypothetical protein
MAPPNGANSEDFVPSLASWVNQVKEIVTLWVLLKWVFQPKPTKWILQRKPVGNSKEILSLSQTSTERRYYPGKVRYDGN